MSAAILWEPDKPEKHRRFDVPAPSSFIEAMSLAGFNVPCVLTDKDLPTIAGMSAVFGHHEVSRPNPYFQIANAIEKHGSIRIWAEY